MLDFGFNLTFVFWGGDFTIDKYLNKNCLKELLKSIK